MDRIVTDCYCSNGHNRFEGATVTLLDTYLSNTCHWFCSKKSVLFDKYRGNYAMSVPLAFCQFIDINVQVIAQSYWFYHLKLCLLPHIHIPKNNTSLRKTVERARGVVGMEETRGLVSHLPCRSKELFLKEGRKRCSRRRKQRWLLRLVICLIRC